MVLGGGGERGGCVGGRWKAAPEGGRRRGRESPSRAAARRAHVAPHAQGANGGAPSSSLAPGSSPGGCSQCRPCRPVSRCWVQQRGVDGSACQALMQHPAQTTGGLQYQIRPGPDQHPSAHPASRLPPPPSRPGAHQRLQHARLAAALAAHHRYLRQVQLHIWGDLQEGRGASEKAGRQR